MIPTSLEKKSSSAVVDFFLDCSTLLFGGVGDFLRKSKFLELSPLGRGDLDLDLVLLLGSDGN